MHEFEKAYPRRLPVGADIRPEGIHFRVWAPECSRVRVVFEGAPDAGGTPPAELTREAGGYFAGVVKGAGEGALYRFQLDDSNDLLADPASRFQPQGPLGPSQAIDPARFAWQDADWRGVTLPGTVIYEIHLGTFTPPGTWRSAAAQLPALAETGINLLEIMPVAEFPGSFGWGYDGVNLFAPSHLYGTPDDMRFFVNEAHRRGIGVILDVVYNHFGFGSTIEKFSRAYFSHRETEWGRAINFDGELSQPVREFVTANAAYWISEFHLDGLRLDATQSISDDSPEHIIGAIAASVRQAAGGRATLVIAENEPQQVRIIKPAAKGGYGCDAVWNDDFHHAARVALTGRTEAYYQPYRGTPQEFISCAKRGYLYQGQYYHWQKKRRGTAASGIEPAQFVHYLQNHDQVANSAHGLRIKQLASPGSYRAMTALLLLAPQTPLLFQGQEFGASAPFLYFADMPDEVAELVRKGRVDFLRQFRSIAESAMRDRLADPVDRATFERCKIDHAERQKNAADYRLHRDLLRLRREDAVFRAQAAGTTDGAVLADRTFLLRYFGGQNGDRLVIVNLGRDSDLEPDPEPLLAPPEDCRWELIWSSEDPVYGGSGNAPPEDNHGHWLLTGQSTVVLRSVEHK